MLDTQYWGYISQCSISSGFIKNVLGLTSKMPSAIASHSPDFGEMGSVYSSVRSGQAFRIYAFYTIFKTQKVPSIPVIRYGRDPAFLRKNRGLTPSLGSAALQLLRVRFQILRHVQTAAELDVNQLADRHDFVVDFLFQIVRKLLMFFFRSRGGSGQRPRAGPSGV